MTSIQVIAMEKKTSAPENAKPAEQETPVTPVEETPVDPIAELIKKCDEANDRYLRLVAEFENYKTRTQRDAENTVRYANAKFARDMLDVLDNFEPARKGGDDDLRAGLEKLPTL